MKSKFVVALAIIGFSASVFANKVVVDKTKVEARITETKEKLKKGAITTLTLTKEMVEANKSSLSPEKIDAGNKSLFGENAEKAAEFLASLDTAAKSGNQQLQRFAEVTMQSLGKLGGYHADAVFAKGKDGKVDAKLLAEMNENAANLKFVLKDVALTSIDQAASKYMSQLDAMNSLLHSRYSRNTSEGDRAKLTPDYINKVGVLNIKAEALGVVTEGKTILTLEKIENDQAKMKTLEDLLKEYKDACKG